MYNNVVGSRRLIWVHKKVVIYSEMILCLLSEHYLNMSLEEKREQYKCGSGNQVELTSTDVQRWPDYAKYHNIPGIY